MNKIKVKINFENRSCSVSGVELTNGDYNSTKIEFEFDRTDGTKVFEMKKANGELVFSDEIINNEIVLVRYDEDNNPCSVFDEEGQYVFEVNLYSGDSKLTSDFGVIYVAKEQVQIGDEIAEAYLPIFDRMIQELEVAIDETNNLDIDATGTTVIITRKDGTTKEVETKGDTGETGQSGFSPIANVETTGSNSVVTITDELGTTTATIHTPVRGTDYWTNTDKETVVQDVLNSEEIEQIETNVETANTSADEAKSLARQCNKAKGYANYEALVNELNAATSDAYMVGQSFLVQTTNVPDLWVYSIEETSVEYGYYGDEMITRELYMYGFIQVGYYKLSMLETLKQDLTNYVQFHNYATTSQTGVVYVGSADGLKVNSYGRLSVDKATNSEITGKTNVFKPIVPANLDYAVNSVVLMNYYDMPTIDNMLSSFIYGPQLPFYVREILPEVKTIVDNTLYNNVIYDLGEQTSLSLNLPSYAEVGNWIEVDFLSGSTPTTLTITASALSDYDITPEANTIYSLFFEYGRLDTSTYGWYVSYSEHTRTGA